MARKRTMAQCMADRLASAPAGMGKAFHDTQERRDEQVRRSRIANAASLEAKKVARDAGYRDGFEGQPFGHSVHKMTLAYQQGFSAGMVAVGIRETKT